MKRALARPVVLATALVAAAPAGCRVGKTMISDPDDYAAYRLTRTERSLEERLVSAERYLEERPSGAFAPEVRRWFERAEEAYFASKSGSVAGLSAYLDVLPRGPHAAVARRDLAAKRAASVDLLGRAAVATEGRLRGEAEARRLAREELPRWVARFADGRVFEDSLAAAPGALVVAFGLSLPAPRCASDETAPSGSRRRCTKVVERPFTLPDRPSAGAGRERVLVAEITIEEGADGRVCRARIAGPALFSRWEEASSFAPADEGEGRAQALRAALAMARGAIETRLGGCAPSAPPTERSLDLACGPLRAVARAGEGGGDDEIEISRASTCPSP
jgi:hypothetical protein